MPQMFHGGGADPARFDPAGAAQAVRRELDAFTARRDNPHGVTASQVGADPAGMAAAMLPRGIIAMWSGSASDIPAGWTLCNGQNGTPNLLDRFIVGAGSGYAPGTTGGAASVTLALAQIPAHSHAASGLTCASAGEHSHVVPYTRCAGYHSTDHDPTDLMGGGLAVGTSSAGIHTHTISGSIGGAGGGGAHENRPPYYALCFIMKL